MPARTRRALLVAAVAAIGMPLLAAAPSVSAAGSPTIRPGGEVNLGEVSCEIGAVMRQGHTVYLAIPASCGGIDAGKVQPQACYGPTIPVGVPVSIGGAKHHGTLVYNSFSEMQHDGVTNPNRCHYNDLALVRVNRHDRHLVSATIPSSGAPRSIAARLPKSGTPLRFGSNSATAGATQAHGWVLMASTSAMLKTADTGAPVTVGKRLVGMLVVLPKGPIPNVPLFEAPAQIFNLARAIHLLHQVPKFRHVHVVHAGEKV